MELPEIIVIDANSTLDSADIYADHMRVHPGKAEQAIEGLTAMFGDVFTILTVEEYDEIKSKEN